MIVIVAGISGSGKSTVGSALAQRLGWGFEDGDKLHPLANIAKMSAGVPLTDADRRPWLAAIEEWMDTRRAAGTSAVLACSALRRSYRDELTSGRPDVKIAFLEISRELATIRITARHGHFFGANLLDSQLAVLQSPEPGETSVLTVQVRPVEQPSAEVADIVRGLNLANGRPAD